MGSKMVKRINASNIWPSRAYTIDEVAKLLCVSRTTVFTWISDGLRSLKTREPHLIIGGELKVFLAQRVHGKTAAFSTDVFVCMRCQAGRAPAGNMIDYYHTAVGAVRIIALCEVCGGALSAFTNTAALTKLARTYELVLRPATQVECSNGTKSKATQRGRPHARLK
jgi:excisionase family DNA binding protein